MSLLSPVLKELRKLKNVDLKEMSESTGLTQNRINLIETVIDPTYEEIAVISKFYDFPVQSFIFFLDNKNIFQKTVQKMVLNFLIFGNKRYNQK